MNKNTFGDLLPNIISLMLLTQQPKKKFKALPQSEQDQIIAKRESDAEQKRITQHIQQHIQQGICPHCEGKLIRGKKDKKNDYMRTWKCSSCEKDIIH